MSFGSWRAWITIAAGAAVSAIFLWFALRQIEVQDVLAAFKTANYLYVLASAAALVAGLMLRATRWRLIANAQASKQGSFMRATYIGSLSNMVLPARAGEFIRIFTLVRLTGSRLVNSVVSSVMDRLVDIIMLLIVTAGLYFFMPRTTVVDKWLGTIVIVGGAIVVGVFILAVIMGWGRRWLTLLAERLLKGWKLRPDVFFSELHNETRQLLRGWKSVKLLSVVILIVVLDCLAIGGQLLAFHLQLPVVATILLWVFLSIGSMLPSAPGYIGVYQTAAIWGLSVFYVPPSSAVAVAIVLQATMLAVTFLMVGPSVFRLLKTALEARKGTSGK
tara:strand:+ start:20737 stop:21732 length:996 start_codon:yes stop_codon:yes gene_type:complete